MLNARQSMWLMLLLVPFALGNKECGSSSHESDASTPGKDAGAGAFCGGIAGVACKTGEYCNFTEQCGAADQGGHCTKIPDACTKEYHPVCGCDDKTYGNACMAALAGVSVLHEGACTGPASGDAGSGGPLCGTRGGTECGAGQYCKFGEGALCGRADAGGTCTALPQICPDIVIPVCGCDNKTYNNECQAARDGGVGVLHSGACEPQPCNSCAGPMPGAPNMQCADGVHFSGPACVTGDDGKCGWHILECPSEVGGACDQRPRDPGQCWTNEQCPSGTKCIGATCCPANARCLVEDHPGTCQ